MIYHITTKTEWLTAQETGTYTAPSLAAEGFIHCAYAEQVAGVVGRFYAGQTGLLVLEIDPAGLAAAVVDEDSYGHGSFPHVYGGIDVGAVGRVLLVGDF